MKPGTLHFYQEADVAGAWLSIECQALAHFQRCLGLRAFPQTTPGCQYPVRQASCREEHIILRPHVERSIQLSGGGLRALLLPRPSGRVFQGMDFAPFSHFPAGASSHHAVGQLHEEYSACRSTFTSALTPSSLGCPLNTLRAGLPSPLRSHPSPLHLLNKQLVLEVLPAPGRTQTGMLLRV